MTEITRERIEALMKRCQIGVGPRQMNEAHDIMADCYGVIGSLVAERDSMREAIELWLDAYDSPEAWMECRHRAKAAVGRPIE